MLTKSRSLAPILLLALALPASTSTAEPETATPPEPIGSWIGPCSDGKPDGVRLIEPARRVRTFLRFRADGILRHGFLVYLDLACEIPHLVEEYVSRWSFAPDSNLDEGTVSGMIDEIWLAAASTEAARTLNDPKPFCGDQAWNPGDRRRIDRCSIFGGGRFRFRLRRIDDRRMEIPSKNGGEPLPLKRVSPARPS